MNELGGVPLERIRRSPSPGHSSKEGVVRLEAEEGRLCELVDGALVEKALGYDESTLALALGSLLRAFVNAKNLGKVSGEAGMIRLFPGLIRIPDVAYASWTRLKGANERGTAAPAIVPDRVAEILSELVEPIVPLLEFDHILFRLLPGAGSPRILRSGTGPNRSNSPATVHSISLTEVCGHAIVSTCR